MELDRNNRAPSGVPGVELDRNNRAPSGVPGVELDGTIERRVVSLVWS